MDVNLALHILRYMIVSASVGQGSLVKLSPFREQIKAPRETFHRHINNLIENGFISRVSRDVYTLNTKFIDHVIIAHHQLPKTSMPTSGDWI